MTVPKVFFVHLRRPGRGSKNRKEQRDDPYWEFGSFGCTKCHSRNLLHPRRSEELKGARLAFIQGGPSGSRLVFLTPPITHVKVRKDKDMAYCEVRWTPAEMPFKYTEAPLLAYNAGRGNFRLVEKFARATRCPTVESRLSSRCRSRALPLTADLANEVIAVYERHRAAARQSAFASTYDQALPYAPPIIDRNREATYRRYISGLARGTDGAQSVLPAKVPPLKAQARSPCGRSRCRRSEPRTTRRT